MGTDVSLLQSEKKRVEQDLNKRELYVFFFFFQAEDGIRDVRT